MLLLDVSLVSIPNQSKIFKNTLINVFWLVLDLAKYGKPDVMWTGMFMIRWDVFFIWWWMIWSSFSFVFKQDLSRRMVFFILQSHDDGCWLISSITSQKDQSLHNFSVLIPKKCTMQLSLFMNLDLTGKKFSLFSFHICVFEFLSLN
jgi:hypothetical protein